MNLNTENFTFKGLLNSFVVVCYFLCSTLNAQSNCKVRVGAEPTAQLVITSAGGTSQSGGLPHFKPWEDLPLGVGEDNKSTKVNLLAQNTSSTLKFSNFNFNIPIGSKIDGIIVSLKGRREGAGFVNDNIIRLTSGSTVSDNFGGKGYNAMNVFAKSTTDRKWKYGFHEKTWGHSWTSSEINDPSFGLELQLINITAKEVTAFIDDVKIEIEYTQAPTFCFTDCFPVYTDLVVGASSYFWHIPQGFEMISKSEKHNIIDFKVLNAQAKVYNVCVDALDSKGKVIEQCCRDIRIRSCVPAKIGNFVWNDVNYNGLQEIGEQGVPNVKVSLFNLSNVLIKTSTTTLSGAYALNDIPEGSYYIKVEYPDNYINTISNLSNAELNSDFKSGNVSNILNVQFGDNLTNLDFGLVKKLEIGDFVWEDTNYNGLQDVGENGIKNTIVGVYNEQNVLLAQDTTDSNGAYSFKDLAATKYYLKFKLDTVYIPTKVKSGNATIDSDVNENLTTDLINFENKNQDTSVDAGFVRYGSIGDFVWNDINQNGLQDVNEVGEEGLTIYLKNEAGNIIDEVTTKNGGGYQFSNVLPGNYKIQILLPDFTSPTTANAANPLGSDLKSFNGLFETDVFTLASNQSITDIDLGYNFLNARICGKIWTDANADGQYMVGEELVSEYTVTLFDELLALKDVQTTKLDGSYCFDSLSAGNYKVVFAIDDDLQYTNSNVGSDDTDSDVLSNIGSGSTAVITVMPGDTILNIDAGIVKRSVIGDIIWEDTNYDGIKDVSEVGLSNVELSLFDESDNLITTQVTDQNGAYLFQNIPAGLYKIKATTPANYLVTKYNSTPGILTNTLSLINGVVTSDIISVTRGSDRLDIDGGFTKAVNIGGLAWDDTNADGTRSDDEIKFIPTIVVVLLDENGTIVATDTTDENGTYSFGNKAAISYKIKFNLPNTYTVSPYNVGDAQKDNDCIVNFETALIDFKNGISNLNLDAGVFRPGCIGDFAWLDTDEDGIQNGPQDGLADVLITINNLADNTSIIYVTDTTGSYSFCNLKPGKYILKYNVNQAYKPTLNGLGSTINTINNEYYSDTITINSGDTLYNVDAGFIYRPVSKICGLAWNDSNGNGIYEESEAPFPLVTVYLLDSLGNKVKKLKSDQNGLYCFENLAPAKYFLKYFVKDDYQFTFSNIGDELTDSDAIGLIDSAITEVIHLKANTDIGYVFVGITKRSQLGDFVWFDGDKNGIQDLLEIGIPGVPVSLCNDANAVISSTVTDNNGLYMFDKIPRGNYIVKFPINPTFDFTLKGIDAINGSDVDENGSTGLITVLQNENNLDIDAGYALKGGLIAGEVWQDINKDTIRGMGDTLLIGVNVYLFDENGMLVNQTISTTNGDYNFYPVPVGNYYVKFDSTIFNSYVNDVSKVYADVTNEYGRGTTSLINVAAGSIISGIDAGYVDVKSSIKGIAWLDDNGNGKRDTLETPTNKVKVWLCSDNGDLIDSTYTNLLDGSYVFDSLLIGNYIVKFDTISSNYQFTKNIGSGDTLVVSVADENGVLDTLSLSICDNIVGQNAGYRGFGNLKGESFLDENENGISDDNVAGINNVAVCLVDLDNNIVATDTTSSENLMDGIFSFSKIPAGEYRLKVRRPLFYIFTTEDINGNSLDNTDSDVSLLNTFDAYSKPFTISTQSNIFNIDFGLIFRVPMNSSISGVAWEELSVDGIRNIDEFHIDGIEMILYDNNNNEIKRDTTFGDGFYKFSNISEGFYYVKAILPSDKTATFLNVGTDFRSDNNFTNTVTNDATEIFYLGIGQDTTFVDLGYTGEVMIGNFVWEDLNFDGLQSSDEPGLPNIEVSVCKFNGEVIKKTKTNANGGYLFNNIPQGFYDIKFKKIPGYSATKQKVGNGVDDSCIDENCNSGLQNFTAGMYFGVDAGLVKNASVGDRVWVDFNSNGLQNGGEPGKDSITLDLYKSDGTFVASTTTFTDMTTGETGKYVFKNLRPGDYYIEMATPENFKHTLQGASDEDLNSDFDATGKSSTFTLLPNENKTSIDGGLYLPGCIGNRVWLDSNKNGIQDEGESGVKDIEVKIFKGNGSLVTTGKTDENGIYLFTDLTQGLYYASFTIDLPYKFTILDEGTEATDNDANELGITPLISLAHAAKFYDLDAGVYISSSQLSQANETEITSETNTPLAKKELIVSPNPAYNQIQINMPFGPGNVVIFDANGKKIEEFHQERKYQWHNVNNYKAGIYFIKISTGDKVTESKFIKVE
jgi:protocatechuate 3,4-dioxygenase beta subunit